MGVHLRRLITQLSFAFTGLALGALVSCVFTLEAQGQTCLEDLEGLNFQIGFDPSQVKQMFPNRDNLVLHIERDGRERIVKISTNLDRVFPFRNEQLPAIRLGERVTKELEDIPMVVPPEDYIRKEMILPEFKDWVARQIAPMISQMLSENSTTLPLILFEIMGADLDPELFTKIEEQLLNGEQVEVPYDLSHSVEARAELGKRLSSVLSEIYDLRTRLRKLDRRDFDMEFYLTDYYKTNFTKTTDPATTINVYTEMLAAMREVHRRGFVHRDLKFANILLDDEGRPKGIDWELSGDEFDERGKWGTAPFLRGTEEGAYLDPWPFGRIHRNDDLYAIGEMIAQSGKGRWPELERLGEELKSETARGFAVDDTIYLRYIGALLGLGLPGSGP